VRATEKIAEHGGGHSDDLAVPLVVSGASVPDGVRESAGVQTKQIAPTILSLLGLDPRSVQAVREEHTTGRPPGWRAASCMARAQPFGPAGVVVVLKPSVLLAWTAKSLVNVLLISREQRAASSEQRAKREAGPAGLR
jgi:hypothetical protein